MEYLKHLERIENLVKNEDYIISRMCNISAYLNEILDDINWVGFYIVKDNILKLGPFQGKVACSNIPKGKGVCGTCYEKLETIVVPNVLEFEGHIACDEKSRSEIVVPIIRKGEMIGLLDIDAPIYRRFNDEELVKFLEEVVKFV